MQPRIFTLSCTSLFLGLCLILVSGTAISQEVSPGCEAAMDKVAGSLSECLLKADAQFAKGGDEGAKEAAQARCGERFDRDSARALSRFGADQCTPASLVTAMADRTASCAESLASEAGGRAAAARLYVQDAQAATLSDSLLVLSDVDDETLWFTDRPYRETGQLPTEDFVALFSEEGLNSFASDPPNADLSCEVDGEVVNRVVTLQNPVRTQVGEDTWDLHYTAHPTEEGTASGPVSCDGDAHLFIDDTTATASACTQSYNCFLGGVCSHSALSIPPAQSG